MAKKCTTDPAAANAARENLEQLLSRDLPEELSAITSLLAELTVINRTLPIPDQRIPAFRRRVRKHLDALRLHVEHGARTARNVLPSPPRIASGSEPSVGDINLLINRSALTEPPLVAALQHVIGDLITQTSGRRPQTFGVAECARGNDTDKRLVVRWRLNRSPTLRDLVTIHELTDLCHDEEILGRTDTGRGWKRTVKVVDERNRIVPKCWGIHFGPGSYHGLTRGVTVSRVYGRDTAAKFLKDAHPLDWITRPIECGATGGFTVELREGGDPEDRTKTCLDQAAFAMLVVHLAFYLAHGEKLDHRDLAIATFRALNRVGAESADHAQLFGLTETRKTIERVLLLPFQQPQVAKRYQFVPESILLAGVPGVGKTLLAKWLMVQPLNAILVSVGGLELLADLTDPKKESRILLRIDEIGSLTELPVVLLVDDIDVVMDQEQRDKGLISKLLNLLQGVREMGFNLIASTNKPEAIDERLLEPGRLSKVVHVRLPDEAERTGILRLMLQSLPFANPTDTDSIAAAIARGTRYWTGRHLWELVQESGRLCGLEIAGWDVFRPVDTETPMRNMALADFLEGKKLAAKGVNVRRIRQRDREIAEFVSLVNTRLGFHSSAEEE